MQLPSVELGDFQDLKHVSDVILNRNLYPERPKILLHRNAVLLQLETEIFEALHDKLLDIEPVLLGNHYFRAVLDARDLFPIMSLLDGESRLELSRRLTT